MFDRDNSVPPFSFFEVEAQARMKRALVIEACARGTMHAFARWLRLLALRSTRLVRGLAAEGRLRGAMRELGQLDDRTLADMGVTRGEIESAVRDGLPVRAARKRRRRDWNSVPPRRQAA